jgi:hypothetical protein
MRTANWQNKCVARPGERGRRWFRVVHGGMFCGGPQGAFLRAKLFRFIAEDGEGADFQRRILILGPADASGRQRRDDQASAWLPGGTSAFEILRVGAGRRELSCSPDPGSEAMRRRTGGRKNQYMDKSNGAVILSGCGTSCDFCGTRLAGTGWLPGAAPTLNGGWRPIPG